MKKILLIGVAVISAAAGVALAAATTAKTLDTSASKMADEATEGFNLIHVADLEKIKDQAFIFDANNEETRVKEGVIPGAKTLMSSSQYSMATLPQDKTAHLVFYCANTMCMASHDAAKRAVAAGYKNVSVMADGIQGWKKAGKKADPYSPTKS